MDQNKLLWLEKIGMDILIIILLLIVIFGLFNVIKKLDVETIKCLEDPVGYYNSLGEDKCYCFCEGGRIYNNSGYFGG